MSDPNSTYTPYQPIPPSGPAPQYPAPYQSNEAQPQQYQPPPPQQYYAPVPPPGAQQYQQPGNYQQPMYAPVQPGQQVMMSTPSAQMAAVWTNAPQVAYCNNCRSQGVTNVKFTPGACTWLSCIGCLCVGCYMGCCLIPFCVDSLQDCCHHCSNCGEFLGRKSVI